MKPIKTNVMRILDSKKIEYEPFFYEPDAALTGVQIAGILGEDPSKVFKTLVATGASKTHYVFVIPVECELDLKKAAAAVGEKNMEMLKAKELLPLTGYVHGGCSPIGMKKEFATTVDIHVNDCEDIYFSAGKLGCQVHMSISNLTQAFCFKTADVTKA